MKVIAKVIYFGLVLLVCPAANASGVRVLILGDSLTEGYGVPQEKAFPAVLQRLFQSKGRADVSIINAGESGSTSASGVGRLKWQLAKKPDILILALGANDGLRGVAVAETEKNLSQTITLAQSQHIRVLLAGMKLPPNYGPTYSKGFASMFKRLALRHHVQLIPFFLEGVAGDRSLNQEDGIHPNEKGHVRVARTVLHYLEPLL